MCSVQFLLTVPVLLYSTTCRLTCRRSRQISTKGIRLSAIFDAIRYEGSDPSVEEDSTYHRHIRRHEHATHLAGQSLSDFFLLILSTHSLLCAQ